MISNLRTRPLRTITPPDSAPDSSPAMRMQLLSRFARVGPSRRTTPNRAALGTPRIPPCETSLRRQTDTGPRSASPRMDRPARSVSLTMRERSIDGDVLPQMISYPYVPWSPTPTGASADTPTPCCARRRRADGRFSWLVASPQLVGTALTRVRWPRRRPDCRPLHRPVHQVPRKLYEPGVASTLGTRSRVVSEDHWPG